MNNNNYGALIDLSQLKHGKELKHVIDNFDKTNSKINISVNKRIAEINEKYNTLEKLLSNDLDILESNYADDLKKINEYINEHKEYAEETYMKKSNLKISMNNLDDELKEKILWLLSNSGNSSGYMKDYKGTLRKIEWAMYFILFADKIIHVSEIKNNSMSTSKVITWEDWYGENYLLDDFSNNSVELWMYDRPAESYLPLFYLPADRVFDPKLDYYLLTNGIYVKWDKGNYNADTWDYIRSSIYYLDEASYENELIRLLEKNDFPKTYIFRNLGEYTETPNENDLVERKCGKVSYNADARRFTFDNPLQSRYIFKIVKYEY